jgi:hypothetical protein
LPQPAGHLWAPPGPPTIHGIADFAIGGPVDFPNGETWPRCYRQMPDGGFSVQAYNKSSDLAYCDGPESKFQLTIPDGVLTFQGKPVGRYKSDWASFGTNELAFATSMNGSNFVEQPQYSSDRYDIIEGSIKLRSTEDCLSQIGGVIRFTNCSNSVDGKLPVDNMRISIINSE